MNFEHTHERRLLGETIGRYAGERYGEVTRRMVPQSARPFDATHWNALVELGALGALFDPAHGGYGGSPFDTMAVFEALGRALVCEPLLANLLAGRVLAATANTASEPNPTHAQLLECIVAGTTLATLAHCENGGQWDPAQVACAARQADGQWRLDGHKVAVPWGAQAQVLLVSARNAGAAHEEEGISLFVVPADTPGLTLRGHPGIDGDRSSAEVLLHDVRLPPHALVGTAGQGAAALGDSIGHGILAICAEALGAMEFVMAGTLDYLRTRQQFGAPIGSFQAVQHRMVELMLQVEQARSATLNCAVHMVSEVPLRDRFVAAAKYSVGSAALLIAQECIQLHGGIGMTWELPVSHYAKRLALINFRFGDEDFHLDRYVRLTRRNQAFLASVAAA